MSGMFSALNSTSTTGPMTRATRPGCASVAASPPAAALSAVVVMMNSLFPCGGLGQRVGAADDLADFLGDLGLSCLVGLKRELLGQLVGVVGGRLHGPPPGRDLRGGGLQQRVVDPALHVPRQ